MLLGCPGKQPGALRNSSDGFCPLEYALFAGHLDKLLCVGVGGANLNHETFQRTVNNCMNSALLTCSLSLRPGFCQRLQPKRDIAGLQTVVSEFLEQSKQSLRDPRPFPGWQDVHFRTLGLHLRLAGQVRAKFPAKGQYLDFRYSRRACPIRELPEGSCPWYNLQSKLSPKIEHFVRRCSMLPNFANFARHRARSPTVLRARRSHLNIDARDSFSTALHSSLLMSVVESHAQIPSIGLVTQQVVTQRWILAERSLPSLENN